MVDRIHGYGREQIDIYSVRLMIACEAKLRCQNSYFETDIEQNAPHYGEELFTQTIFLPSPALNPENEEPRTKFVPDINWTKSTKKTKMCVPCQSSVAKSLFFH